MEDGQSPFTNWVKMNASTANLLSIIMLIFAAWAAVEIVSNVTGNEIPPVTGMETNDDPKDTQRVNNGAIIGLGAVAGTLGLVLQLLLPREESEDVVESTPEEDSDIDDVVDVIQGNDQALQDVGSLLGFAQVKLGAPNHHFVAVLDVVHHHLLQVYRWRPHSGLYRQF